MNSSVADLIAETIDKEGPYSDDPDDSGGETAWGVTARRARKFGYTGPMRDMPRSIAEAMYEHENWYESGFYDVSILSMPIARELFDTGINCGVGRASEFLQIALNALNRQEKDYKDIPEDGDVGPATIGALTAYLQKRGARGEHVMLRALNCLQGAFYINLSRSRQKDETFLYGWLDNRVAI